MSNAGAAFSSMPLETRAAGFPLRYFVPEPERPLSRARTFFRSILLIPAAVVLGVVGWIAGLITLAAWFVILFTGRYDRSLWSFPAGYVERYARYLTSASLLRDELPPLAGGEYPTEFELQHPPVSSRWKAFFRGLLLIPLWIALCFWGAVWLACVVIAWFAILFSGRYPEGIRRLVVGLNRWYLRVLAYALLLRDEYPPFSLGLEEPAPAPLPAPDILPAQPLAPAEVTAPWRHAGEPAPAPSPTWYEETRAAPPSFPADSAEAAEDAPTMLYRPRAAELPRSEEPEAAEPADEAPTMLYPLPRTVEAPPPEQGGTEAAQEQSTSPEFYTRPQRTEDRPDAG
ncbi:MAG TPA: DUF4389 domain-containing protein [Dehalococcoidia bacterium]|jgi:hypothetical protein|nr:DUF4389 domain-containing protein [Dehalococcoidia bacterium]